MLKQKKENIGNFKNNGQEYRHKKDPRKVLDHDFPIEELGKISPYGVYNLNSNTGFVNVGISHDTSEFAVESISRWWDTVGKHTFPDSKKIYITCDSGGSNGYRVRIGVRCIKASIGGGQANDLKCFERFNCLILIFLLRINILKRSSSSK